eukprot:68862_1
MKNRNHERNTNKEIDKNIFTLKQIYNQSQLDIIHSYLCHYDWKEAVRRQFDQHEQKMDEETMNETNEEAKTDEFNRGDKYISEFGFGVRHVHVEMSPIYNSIWDEIIYNKECSLGEALFRNVLIKAIKKYPGASNFYHCTYFDRRFQIMRNEQVGIRHILAVIFYTDVSNFCKAFRETYRKKKGETERKLVDRHRELYQYARSLYECIQFFGEYM